MGSIQSAPLGPRDEVVRDLKYYQAQQATTYALIHRAQTVREYTVSPARKRAEAECIGRYMLQHWRTYEQAATLQQALGLHSEEGVRYG